MLKRIAALSVMGIIFSITALADGERLVKLVATNQQINGTATLATSGIYCRGATQVRFYVSAFRCVTAPNYTFDFAMADTNPAYAGGSTWGAQSSAPAALNATSVTSGGEAVTDAFTITVSTSSTPLPCPANYARLRLTGPAGTDTSYNVTVLGEALYGSSGATANARPATFTVAGVTSDANGNFTAADSIGFAGMPVGTRVYDDINLIGGRKGGVSVVTTKYNAAGISIAPAPAAAFTSRTLTFIAP